MKQNKLLILALLALGLQAHGSADVDTDTQEATGHDKVKFLRQKGSTTMGRQADKDAKMDERRKRNQANNKAKLDQAKKTAVVKPVVKKETVQPAQKETRSIAQKAQETRNARQQKPMTVKEKAAAQRKTDSKKDKEAALPAGDMPVLTKKEKRAKKAIQTRIEKKNAKVANLQEKLAVEEDKDQKDLRNAGRYINSDIQDYKKHIGTLTEEVEHETERLALLTPEHKEEVKQQAIKDAQYYEAMDKLLNAKREPLRKERSDLQDQAHRLMIQGRNVLASLKEDTKAYRAQVALKRTLNDKLSADDKAQKDMINEAMALKNPEIEAIDARIKEIDAQLAKLGADLRANEPKHTKAIETANKYGADLQTLSAKKADDKFTQEVLDGKTARLWTQEDLEIKKRAKEMGMKTPPAKVRSAGFEDHLGKQ